MLCKLKEFSLLLSIRQLQTRTRIAFCWLMNAITKFALCLFWRNSRLNSRLICSSQFELRSNLQRKSESCFRQAKAEKWQNPNLPCLLLCGLRIASCSCKLEPQTSKAQSTQLPQTQRASRELSANANNEPEVRISVAKTKQAKPQSQLKRKQNSRNAPQKPSSKISRQFASFEFQFKSNSSLVRR